MLTLISMMALSVAIEGRAAAADPRGAGTWVVDADHEAVTLVPEKGAPRSVHVGRWPSRLGIDSRGRVFVTCRTSGTLVRIDGAETRSLQLGGEPVALVLDEATHRLWVGLSAAPALVLLDSETLEVKARRSVDEAPLHLSLTAGGLAWASNREAVVHFADPALTEGLDWPVVLPANDGRAWHIAALAASATQLAVAYADVRTGMGELSAGGGYGGGDDRPIVPMVALISRNPKTNQLRVSRTRVLAEAFDVSEVTWLGEQLVVASLGAGHVHVLDADLELMASWSERDGISGLAPSGPRSVDAWSVISRKLVRLRYTPPKPTLGLRKVGEPSFSQFGMFALGTKPALTLLPASLETSRARSAGPSALSTSLQRGRQLFFAATRSDISRRGLSCATCHPDGRDDGLVWRLRGTRRNTPSLAGNLHDTAPYNWFGTAATLDENLVQTIQRLDGEGLGEEDRRALTDFVAHGLQAPVAPPSTADDRVARGREVFHRDDVGCASCHPADTAFSDGARHDVLSITRAEAREADDAKAGEPLKAGVDTPTLRALAQTAPYFHNGSVATVEALIDENDDRMGRTRQLDSKEREALAAYLRSL